MIAEAKKPAGDKPGFFLSVRWPAIVIAALSLHVVAMVTAAMIVLQRPGESAVISDYYNKAQSWDAYKHQVAASEQLGWNVNVEPTGVVDVLGHRQMRITLNNAQNQPIQDSQMSVNCYQLSHGDEVATVAASAQGPGQYILNLPQKYSGFWQLEITAAQGNRTFIKTITQWVN